MDSFSKLMKFAMCYSLPLPLTWELIAPMYEGLFIMVLSGVFNHTYMRVEEDAVLYMYPRCTRVHVSDGMKGYRNHIDACHHCALSQYSPGSVWAPSIAHACCDICQTSCLCACQWHHCASGAGSPCTMCCVCTIMCTFILPFAVAIMRWKRILQLAAFHN